jgi:hypothetical protein
MAKQTVPGTKGFQYDFGNYTTDDNPFSLLRNSGDKSKFNETERLNQRARIFIAGYDVTQDVDSFTITNHMDNGMSATIQLMNPRDRYRITRTDLETNMYNVLEDNPKRYGNKDILPTYDLEGKPFSLTKSGMNGLVYKQEMNSLHEKDMGGGSKNKDLQYKDYLFKHMLFIVKWHSGIRKQENDFIFDYKEPVIIFLQGRYSTFWYFGFTGAITSYSSTFAYGGENSINITCASRRHFLGIKSRVLTPAVAQELTETRHIAANNASESQRAPIKELQSGKKIEDIIPDLFLSQTSLNESFKYPVFPVNFVKSTDRSVKKKSWLEFFKRYVVYNRDSYIVKGSDDKKLSGLFTDAFSSLNTIFEKLLFGNGGTKGHKFKDKTKQFNYYIGVDTKSIYKDIDKYVDPLYYKKPSEDITSKFGAVTDRRNINDPLNSVYSAILGDNIYQVSVFSVKPYSGRNVNTILEANTLRFWETDYNFGGKEKNENCVWKSYKSAGVVGVHPAFHEDFINSFHILPKIFDTVVNNLHVHNKVISAGTEEKKETIKGGSFSFSDENGLKFNPSKYTFVSKKRVVDTFKEQKSEGLTLKEFIKKYRENIEEITVVGHASFNPTGGYETGPEFTKKKIEARLTGLYRATVIAEYILSEDYNKVIKDFVTPEVASKYDVDKDLYLNKALSGMELFDASFKDLRDKIKVYTFGYSIPASQSKNTASHMLGDDVDSEVGFLDLIDSLYLSVASTPVTDLSSDENASTRAEEKTDYIQGIIEDAEGLNDYNAVGNAEPNIEEIVRENAKDEPGMRQSKLSKSQKDVSTSGNTTSAQVTYDFRKYKPDESKHRKNRRVEVFVQVRDKEKITPATAPVEVAEGICIELADRTPYDKLKEQVFGVPTETSKLVTGLNFHRPRFIIMIPPLFMSNVSPLALAFREFKLDQQEYGAMKDVLDSICKTTQYVYTETPMGDVIMEPINYDLAPWEMSCAYFGKEKFAAYSSLPDHILEETGSDDGTFMKQHKDIKYINIYPTYISTYKKGQFVGVATNEPGNKSGTKNIPDNINLPVIKPNKIRHPYNVDRINDYNLVYSFKGDAIYTSITVIGSSNTGNAQSNALLQTVQNDNSSLTVLLSKLQTRTKVVNRNIFKTDAIVAGQYVADGFELEQTKLEYEKQAGRISLKMRSAANTLADAIFRGDQKLFDELLYGKDGVGGWFSTKSESTNTNFGTTFLTLINNVLLPYIKKDVETYNKSIKAKSSKSTTSASAPTEIQLRGKITDPDLLNKIHNELSVLTPGSSGEQKVLFDAGASFPHGKVKNTGNDVLFLEYPIQTETAKSAAAREALIGKYIQKDSAPELSPDLSIEEKKKQLRVFAEGSKDRKRSKISSIEESCRTTVQLYLLYLLSKSDQGRKDLEALEKVLNKNEVPESAGTDSTSGSKKTTDATEKVKQSMNPLPFTYADLARLRINGDYNPQADFINLYGYVVYNPITIPWLQTPIDCQVYAMAFFNQFYNNAFGYTVNDLPMTPELLINRPAYFSYINSIGLLKANSITYTANTSASMRLEISYLRRNILERSNGGENIYHDKTKPANSVAYKYGNSYSISDITLDQQVEVDNVFKKEPDGEYSAFRKLGMLHESLAVSAKTFPYDSQKDNSAASQLEYLLEQQAYFRDLYYTKLAELEMANNDYSSDRSAYESEKKNYKKLSAAYAGVSGEISGLGTANSVLEDQLAATTAAKDAEQKDLDANLAKQADLEAEKVSLQQQLDAGTAGPPAVPNYPLTDEGRPILAKLIVVQDDLETLSLTIQANEAAIAVYEEGEVSYNNQIAENNIKIDDKKSGVDMSEEEKNKSAEGIKKHLETSKTKLKEIVFNMDTDYARAMEVFAAIYGLIFNYKVTPPATGDNVSEFTGYLSFDVVYEGIYKPINVFSDDPKVLESHYARWSKPGGEKNSQYVTELELEDIPDEMSKQGMEVEDVSEDYLAYENKLPITIALYEINKKIERIQKGPSAEDLAKEKAELDAEVDALLAEAKDKFTKTGAKVTRIKQSTLPSNTGETDPQAKYACFFACYYMIFDLYSKKQGKRFMSIPAYKSACVKSGAMSNGFTILNRNGMAAAAGFNNLKEVKSQDASIIPSLIDKGVPCIISLNEGEHFELIDGYEKKGSGYIFSVTDPGYQNPPTGDTYTDNIQKKMYALSNGKANYSVGHNGKPRTFNSFFYFPLD